MIRKSRPTGTGRKQTVLPAPGTDIRQYPPPSYGGGVDFPMNSHCWESQRCGSSASTGGLTRPSVSPRTFHAKPRPQSARPIRAIRRCQPGQPPDGRGTAFDPLPPFAPKESRRSGHRRMPLEHTSPLPMRKPRHCGGVGAQDVAPRGRRISGPVTECCSCCCQSSRRWYRRCRQGSRGR